MCVATSSGKYVSSLLQGATFKVYGYAYKWSFAIYTKGNYFRELLFTSLAGVVLQPFGLFVKGKFSS